MATEEGVFVKNGISRTDRADWPMGGVLKNGKETVKKR
jgi:hypothetical protein